MKEAFSLLVSIVLYVLMMTVSLWAQTTIDANPALTRMVVCFSDGVQYALDGTSPYVCPATTGVLTARVYGNYAAKAPFIAVPGGPEPPPRVDMSCTYKNVTYPDMYVLVLMVAKNQVEETQAALLAGGWQVSTKEVKNRFEVTATC